MTVLAGGVPDDRAATGPRVQRTVAPGGPTVITSVQRDRFTRQPLAEAVVRSDYRPDPESNTSRLHDPVCMYRTNATSPASLTQCEPRPRRRAVGNHTSG